MRAEYCKRKRRKSTQLLNLTLPPINPRLNQGDRAVHKSEEAETFLNERGADSDPPWSAKITADGMSVISTVTASDESYSHSVSGLSPISKRNMVLVANRLNDYWKWAKENNHLKGDQTNG
jgi:hypothetical protein